MLFDGSLRSVLWAPTTHTAPTRTHTKPIAQPRAAAKRPTPPTRERREQGRSATDVSPLSCERRSRGGQAALGSPQSKPPTGAQRKAGWGLLSGPGAAEAKEVVDEGLEQVAIGGAQPRNKAAAEAAAPIHTQRAALRAFWIAL